MPDAYDFVAAFVVFVLLAKWIKEESTIRQEQRDAEAVRDAAILEDRKRAEKLARVIQITSRKNGG